MNLKETIQELSALSGPSGFESPVARRAAELLRPFADEVRTDRLGNVIALRRCGRPGAKKLLLDSHLDEIGLMVTDIQEGFLRFRTIGGVDPRMLPGREVRVLAPEPVFGVVACLPPHLSTAETRDKSIPISDMLIDVGMSDREAREKIPVGTPMVYVGDCISLGEKQITGKALDDRSCFSVLARTLELLRGEKPEVDVYVMGSVQEEVGERGAITGTFAVAPDWCVAVDVTHGRTPDAPKERTFPLGCGPVIGIGPNMNRGLTEDLVRLCKNKNIKYELEPMAGSSGTNGWVMQISREGIPTAVVSLPLKYMHTPVETIAPEDGEAAAALLARFALSLKGEK